jgi:hypothetical protein
MTPHCVNTSASMHAYPGDTYTSGMTTIEAVEEGSRPNVVDAGLDTSGLTLVDGSDVPVYVSGSDSTHGRRLAERTTRTVEWLSTLVPMPTTPPLFVLDPVDWLRIALIPQYGLAHVNRTRICLGQQ